MSDVTVTVDDELMVAGVDGVSDAGIDFVDAYNAGELHVVDSGRIVIPLDDVPAFTALARGAGLEVES